MDLVVLYNHSYGLLGSLVANCIGWLDALVNICVGVDISKQILFLCLQTGL